MYVAERAGRAAERLVEQVDSLAAAGQPGEPLQQRRHRNRERERREREIEAGEAPRGQAEREAGGHRHEPGKRDRPEIAEPMVGGQDRGRVGADRHQRPVTE